MMRSKAAKTESMRPDDQNSGSSPVSETSPSAAEPLTAKQIEELTAEAAKSAENWDKLLRTTADFENFKKRAARERQEAIVYANASLMQKLIPVLDNFDMALSAASGAPEAATKSLQTGVNMISQQLRAALLEAGLEEIDATGKVFDPNFHEAVSQMDSTDVPEGHVVQQLRKGFKLRDRLLRPATVIVARKPASADASGPSEA